MNITPFELAQRFVGVKEVSGTVNNPFIMSMLTLDQKWPSNDEVPWCSAFVNYICWLLRLPRTKDLRARSWLRIGYPIEILDAAPVSDIVVLTRAGASKDPNVLDAPGHVGFFAGYNGLNKTIEVLGGNQGDSVKTAYFSVENLLSIRRIV